jgi:hypothetical protein
MMPPVEARRTSANGLFTLLHVVHDDGTEQEIAAGDMYVLRPGHNAWIVGDETFVVRNKAKGFRRGRRLLLLRRLALL